MEDSPSHFSFSSAFRFLAAISSSSFFFSAPSLAKAIFVFLHRQGLHIMGGLLCSPALVELFIHKNLLCLETYPCIVARFEILQSWVGIGNTRRKTCTKNTACEGDSSERSRGHLRLEYLGSSMGHDRVNFSTRRDIGKLSLSLDVRQSGFTF